MANATVSVKSSNSNQIERDDNDQNPKVNDLSSVSIKFNSQCLSLVLVLVNCHDMT